MNDRYEILHICALLFTLLFSVSCAKQLVIPYSSDTNLHSQLIIKPNKPTCKTFVSINDSLIVTKKFIKSVKLIQLPKGRYTVNYSSDISTMVSRLDTTFNVTILHENEITQKIKVPPHNAWYYISNVLIGLLLIVPFLFI